MARKKRSSKAKKSSGSKAAYLEYAKFADDDVVYFFGDVLNSRKLLNNNP